MLKARREAVLLATLQDEVVSALAERVKVEAVETLGGGYVFVRIRLPKGLTEQALLATQECVQLTLQGLDGAPTSHGTVYAPRYVRSQGRRSSAGSSRRQ